jgi:tetrathionate reductase subunit A
MKKENHGVSRREFLAKGALLGGAMLAPDLGWAGESASQNAVLNSKRPDAPYELADPENMIYSVCLQCNTGCGLKCKIQDGVVTKIDGNPYNPWTLHPHLSYATPVREAARVDGSICPKGQAGMQTAYDPYRLRKVLKRAGPRGEGKWMTIPFDQAIREIGEGGLLFQNVPGEESRRVEGLRELMSLRDPEIAEKMAADVEAIWNEKDRSKKQELVEAFKIKHADHLDKLIDPDHPDLGPKNNQIVVMWGRLKSGRAELYKRFAAALGTVNAHGHTTVCQGSLYFTCKAISEQYQEGKFTGGEKFYWQADLENSRFVLFVGANLFEANYGPPNRTVRLTGNLVSGYTRIAVADPRFSKLASKAWKWLPVKPGEDIALAMAILQRLFEENGYRSEFLACANKAAALGRGEKSWSNAAWLVRITDGRPEKFVRAKDLGLAEGHELLVMVNGVPTAFDPNDAQKPVYGDLFVDTALPDGTRVKSALQILRESAAARTFEQWCEQAGCRPKDVAEIARELMKHAPQAAADIHRGPTQHTNGFYAVLAWMSVNMLLGNFDHAGGMIASKTHDIMGKGGLFDLKKHPGAIKPFGISSIRHGIAYEKTTLFAGYPARRNWYPLSSDVYEEIIPSIGDAYPYPVKALFMYMAAPTYALPAGHTNIEILRDPQKIPLVIANDVVVGTACMYADYIFPDLSFLERWEFQGSHPNMPVKVQPVRQPVIAPIPEEVEVFGERLPLSFEALLLGIAEKLNLPGFGKDAFGPGLDFKHPDELYLRMVANLAYGEKTDGADAVSDASADEIELFRRARRHLPRTVFDEERWRRIVGEAMWPKVITVLNRGGRFQDQTAVYANGMVNNAYGKLLNLYQEKTATTVHAGTGRFLAGYATYWPVADYLGREPAALRDGYPLAMITHRTISQTKSRTVADPWLTPLMPENAILINPSDAERLGLRHGQWVRVVSATNPEGVWLINSMTRKPVVGRVAVTQTMRPGVISFALGFGNWATGAADVEIDGVRIRGEARRGKGVHANSVMWTDPALRNTCMFDPVGGSVSFYDTWVKLVPGDESAGRAL